MTVPPVYPLKTCTKCAQVLPLTDYYVKVKATGRLFSWCKECHKRLTNGNPKHGEWVRQWQRDNPVAVKQIQERHRTTATYQNTQRLREQRDEVRAKRAAYKASAAGKAAAARYRERHAAQIRSSNAAYYAANAQAIGQRVRHAIAKNPEKYRAIHSDWKKRNPAAQKASYNRYRARIKGNGGSFTAFEWERVKAQADWTCLLCGRREPDITLTADHIVPVSRGGWNIISNIQPLCRPCNSTKHRAVLDLRR